MPKTLTRDCSSNNRNTDFPLEIAAPEHSFGEAIIKAVVFAEKTLGCNSKFTHDCGHVS